MIIGSDIKTNHHTICITIKGLRELITRLEREKTILDGKVKSASRELNIKTNVLTVRFEEATAEARKLREEMDATRHGELMAEPQGVETLKMRNKFLQVYYYGRVFGQYMDKKHSNIENFYIIQI